MRKKQLYLLGDFRSIQLFASVVETSSIVRSARRFGVTSSTISKKITELENRARVRLLNRTTRQISVTEAGQTFYQHCLRLLEEIEQAEQALRAQNTQERGRLRVTAPVIFAERRISPLLPEFIRRHPLIEIEMLASARTVNFVEEGFDLSIRIVRGSHIGRNGRVLCNNKRVFCASPRYLAKHGEPKHPKDLANHSCLVVRSVQRTDSWRYIDAGHEDEVRISGPLVSDNAAIIVESAVRGAGITLLGTFAVANEIRRGRLRPILERFVPQDSYIVMIVPNHALMPRRVGVFIDFLKERIGDPPSWDL